MATHSSTLAWKIPWEESGWLQSMGSLRVRHHWVASISLFTFMHCRRKWQPNPVFLPGKSQGRGSLVGCCLWGRRVRHDWSDLAAAAAVPFNHSSCVCVCVCVCMCVCVCDCQSIKQQNRVFTLKCCWNDQTLVLITLNPSSKSFFLKSYTAFIHSAIHMLFPEDPLVMVKRTEGNARSSCLMKLLWSLKF